VAFIANLMYRRRTNLIVIIIVLFNTILTFGQTVQGKLMSSTIGGPLSGIALQLKNTEFETFTNGSGNFSFLQLPDGKYTLIARSEGAEVEVIDFEYVGKSLDLGVLQVELPVISTGSEIATIDVTDLAGIESDDDNFSSVLSAGRDEFTNAAAYNLGAGRFRIRGYNQEDSEMLMNGMTMNDQDDGRVLWNAWSGLNDVLRNQTRVLTLAANDYTFGSIGGATFVDLRATNQREGNRIVYSASNRTYQHRIMATKSTGLMQNGWAFSGAASYRYGQSGYIDGTHFRGLSFFGSVDRKINENHVLNAVIFGAPQNRGRSGGSVQEMYNILNNNYYNSYWGYQNGKVRNSREYRINQPVAMLRHDWKINKNTTVLTNIGYQWGTYASTTMDWYDAPNPNPDYYRKLPSYFTDLAVKESIRQQFINDPSTRQMNWDGFYDANNSRDYTIYNADGVIGNNVRGKLAAYFVEEEHYDNTKFNINSILNTFVGATQLTFGAQYLKEKVHYYEKIDDLLGADFFVDYNQFAIRDFPDNTDARQNDLNRPNRLLKEGDKYGYNYNINTNRVGGWGQIIHKFKAVDVFGALSITNQSFYREGLAKVGLFPDNSFGKSEVANFLNVGAKGGVTYKINGRNYITAIASYSTRAPFANESFVSARTRNQLANNLTSEKILSTEISYIFKYSKFKGRLTGFRTTFKDKLDSNVFYHDEFQTFVNYLMTGIDRVHSGIELGTQYQIDAQWSIVAAGSIGEYYYTSRPLATIARDNSAIDLVTDRTVYIDNYYVPVLQEAATFGINHRNKKFWFANVNVNYFGRNYLSFNPDRRTEIATNGVEDTELFNSIIDEEVLPSAITIDVFAGKSHRFINRHILALNVSVSNILNNTTFRSGGFEQSRFDYLEKKIEKFPPRYFYAFGTNFSINLTYTFK
jgi:CarboxypepD_reg-like domain/TonB dependent receptor